jgi:hypothetical protein
MMIMCAALDHPIMIMHVLLGLGSSVAYSASCKVWDVLVQKCVLVAASTMLPGMLE